MLKSITIGQIMTSGEWLESHVHPELELALRTASKEEELSEAIQNLRDGKDSWFIDAWEIPENAEGVKITVWHETEWMDPGDWSILMWRDTTNVGRMVGLRTCSHGWIYLQKIL